MNNINLRQLEVFVTVVERGSFTEAASTLYLAQSTVSSHIHALEEALHVCLLNRESKKKLILTEDGKRVYHFAKDIVDKCTRLESELDGEDRKELVIGASSAPSQELIPALTAEFLKTHPNCCCTILDGNSEEIQQMLIDHKIQLGFIGTSDNLQTLTYECVAEDHLVLITCNNEHFRSLQDENILGKQLLREPFIFREPNSATQKRADNYLSSLEPDNEINVAVYVSNTNTMLGLVENGIGVAIVSYLTARERIEDGTLLYFELDNVPLSRNIYMARLRKGYISNTAREFGELARDFREK